MSEKVFEHVENVPLAQRRRLSQPQVERLLTPKHSKVTTSGLLWMLDLGVYALPDNDLVIGFGEDTQVHDHDRWLFYTPAPSARWEMVDPENRRTLRTIPGFAEYLDETEEKRRQSQFGDFMVLQTLVTCVSTETKRLQQQYGLDVKERDVLLASRTAGALTPDYLRQRGQLPYKDLHDMVYHPQEYARTHPGLGDMPNIYLRALYGLAY